MSGRGGAVATMARVDLRRRWRTIVAAGLLVGLGVGAGMAGIAGARRTATVFTRHLAETDAPDVEIDPGTFSRESDAELRSLPGVEEASYWVTVSAYPLGKDGSPDLRPLSFTTDGRYLEMDRVSVSAGRRLDPTRPDEVMLDPYYARILGVHVGSKLPIGLFESDENGVPTGPRPTRRAEATVVGIMALNEDVTAEVVDRVARVFVSPAFAPAGHLEDFPGFAWYGLRLRDGRAGADAVIAAWERKAHAHNQGLEDPNQSWLSAVHRTDVLERKANRSVRPLTTALGAFGLLVLMAAVVLAAQAMSRAVRVGWDDLRVAQVLGMTSRQLVPAGMAVAVATMALATAVAAVIAIVGSLAFPIGPYRVLEPHPGVSVDLLVLAGGLALLVVVPLATAGVVAWREAQRTLTARDARALRPSAVAGAAGRAGFPRPVVAALHLTAEPGRGGTFVPVRSVMASISLTVAVLATTLVFGANLRSLADDPPRFGWRADALFLPDGGYGRLEAAALGRWARNEPVVRGWQLVGADRLSVGGVDTPAILLGPSSGSASRLRPVLLEGRAPRRRGEVVLGRATLASLHARVGGKVTLGSGAKQHRATVTGVAVFPVLGPVLAVRTGLDQGAWVHSSEISSMADLASYGPPSNLALLDLAPGTSRTALGRSANADDALTPSGTSTDVFGVVRPPEVRTTDEAGRTEVFVVVVLAATALLSTALTLAMVVRRRRRDLDVYRVVGFTPGQLRWTLVSQGLIISLVALAVGGPVGVVVGRALWQAFAVRLGVVPGADVPLVVLAAAAGLVLVTGLGGAVAPALAVGRRTGRSPGAAR
ncbi:hypothetical protein BH10ACT1_BH10ACT1_16640 [soil metagenome]